MADKLTKRELVELLADLPDEAEIFVQQDDGSGNLIAILGLETCDVCAEGEIPFGVLLTHIVGREGG